MHSAAAFRRSAERRKTRKVSGRPALTELLNEAAAFSETLVLTLEDCHRITVPVIHGSIAFMLERLPPRLRAREQLTQLREADLRFTTEDAAAFLNGVMGPPPGTRRSRDAPRPG